MSTFNPDNNIYYYLFWGYFILFKGNTSTDSEKKRIRVHLNRSVGLILEVYKDRSAAVFCVLSTPFVNDFAIQNK